MGRTKGKTRIHKNITVSQADNYDEYMRQYYKKVLKKKRAGQRKRRKKK